MKKLIMLITLIPMVIFSQESDSTKIVNLEQENTALKQLIVSEYVQKTGKTADEAFTDLYFAAIEMEKKNAQSQKFLEATDKFIGELKEAKKFSEVKAILKKYGIE